MSLKKEVSPLVKHCNKDLCNAEIEDESKCRTAKQQKSNGNIHLAIHGAIYIIIAIVQICRE